MRARLAIYPATPPESREARTAARPSRPEGSARARDSAAPPAAAPARAPTEAEADGLQRGDAAERCRRNQRHVLCRQRRRTRDDPAQSTETPLKASARIRPCAPNARSRYWRWQRSPKIPRVSRSRSASLILPARIATQVVDDPAASRWPCAARARHAERGIPAHPDVPRSLIRLLGAERLPGVAALRPADPTIRAGDARSVARLDHGGDPRQISSRAVRRRTRPRPRRPAANASRYSPEARRFSHRHRWFEAVEDQTQMRQECSNRLPQAREPCRPCWRRCSGPQRRDKGAQGQGI